MHRPQASNRERWTSDGGYVRENEHEITNGCQWKVKFAKNTQNATLHLFLLFRSRLDILRHTTTV